MPSSKILIVSDTHRQNYNYFKAYEAEKPVDLIIHCGDVEGSEYALSSGVECPVEMVMGNNDFFSGLPRLRDFEFGGLHFFVTHGHDYYCYADNERLKAAARERGANVLCYGHIHRPVFEDEGDLVTINPGSLTYPRQSGNRPSYVVATVSEEGKAKYEVKYL